MSHLRVREGIAKEEVARRSGRSNLIVKLRECN